MNAMWKVIASCFVMLVSATVPLAWHIWGCLLLAAHWGPGWGVIGFFLPVATGLVVSWQCLFAWGAWYYLLFFPFFAACAWQAMRMDDDRPAPVVPVLLMAILIAAVCWLGFAGHWGMPDPDIEYEAFAILNAISQDGEGALSDGRLEQKKSRFKSLDGQVQDSVCQMVLSYMTYDVCASVDASEWVRRGRRDFRVSPATLRAAALMPPRLRRLANAENLEEDAPAIALALDRGLGNAAVTTEDLQAASNKGWTTRERVYAGITGRQLPSQAELLMSHYNALRQATP